MRTLQRILALLGVAVLLGMVFLTLYFALTGSPYFLASMFCMIVIPVFIYGYMVVYRALSNKKDPFAQEEAEKESQKKS